MIGARSGFYVGHIRHRRFTPERREFTYPLYMSYLALDELDACERALWPLFGVARRGLTRFRRADHLAGLGDLERPLDEVVRDAVAAAGAPRPPGPITVLSHARHLGFGMNPVSFFYCWDPAGQVVEAVVAEVANTPWDERHVYVLPGGLGAARGARTHRYRFSKAFHVSPFLPLELGYDWRFTTPDQRLAVHMECVAPGPGAGVVLDATLTMTRRPLDRRTLAALLARFPVMTAEVVVHIYAQALRRWLERTPFYPHPVVRTRGSSHVAEEHDLADHHQPGP